MVRCGELVLSPSRSHRPSMKPGQTAFTTISGPRTFAMTFRHSTQFYTTSCFRNMLNPFAGDWSAVRAFSAAFDILSEGMGTQRVCGGGMLRVLQLQTRIR